MSALWFGTDWGKASKPGKIVVAGKQRRPTSCKADKRLLLAGKLTLREYEWRRRGERQAPVGNPAVSQYSRRVAHS